MFWPNFCLSPVCVVYSLYVQQFNPSASDGRLIKIVVPISVLIFLPIPGPVCAQDTKSDINWVCCRRNQGGSWDFKMRLIWGSGNRHFRQSFNEKKLFNLHQIWFYNEVEHAWSFCDALGIVVGQKVKGRKVERQKRSRAKRLKNKRPKVQNI